MIPVPPKSLAVALAHARRGGRLIVATYTRCTVITQKHLDQWERAGRVLLAEDGDGYRMAQGRGTVYLVPGLLKMA